jgi:serine/threonine-protein kinase
MASGKSEDAGAALEGDPFERTVYRAVRRLGGGGMGDVFVVEHQEIGRLFAAKVLRADLAHEPQLIDRLRIEAQALGRLSHPNVVSVVDFAKTEDGRPFFVMELLQGETLAETLRAHGALPVAVAVGCTLELLAALEATHGAGLVHRDVKPSNIFLAQQRDGSFELKLIDFGVTRVLPDAPAGAPAPLSIPTTTGEVVGTPRYVSPEGATGAHVDARADVYAAALVLYTMLAGRGPFDHVDGSGPLRAAHATETPEPPSRYAREPVPAELDALVLRALAKDPKARFATATELGTRLFEVAELMTRPAGRFETRTVAAKRALFPRRPAESDASPPTTAISRPSVRNGALTWLLFTVGVVIAALAVAAVGGLVGAAR